MPTFNHKELTADPVADDCTLFSACSETKALLQLIALGRLEIAEGKFGNATAFLHELDD